MSDRVRDSVGELGYQLHLRRNRVCTITILSGHRDVTASCFASDDVKEGVSMVSGKASVCYLIAAPLCESGAAWK